MKMIRILMISLVVIAFFVAANCFAQTSKPFSGAKVNGGTVSFSKEGGKRYLALSNDFQQKIDTPDPHWQVVDSKGNVYLLDRFEIKDMKFNRKIMVPAYVMDVAKVQFWCAFAVTNLGEASFDKPVK